MTTARKTSNAGRRSAEGKTYAPETLTARVWQMLGLGRRAVSDLELARRVDRGLPASTVRALREDAHLESEVIHRIVLNRRTLSRRRAEATLAPDESDRVVRLARTIALARQTFPGAPDYAEEWLREPKRALRGRAPLDLLTTESGARVIEEMLLQTQEGVFA